MSVRALNTTERFTKMTSLTKCIISVKFRDNFGEYSKEYTYLSDFDVVPGDFVLCPGNPDYNEWYMVARVKRLLTEASLKEGVKYKKIIGPLNQVISPPKTKPPVPQMQGFKMVPPRPVFTPPPLNTSDPEDSPF